MLIKSVYKPYILLEQLQIIKKCFFLINFFKNFTFLKNPVIFL